MKILLRCCLAHNYPIQIMQVAAAGFIIRHGGHLDALFQTIGFYTVLFQYDVNVITYRCIEQLIP